MRQSKESSGSPSGGIKEWIVKNWRSLTVLFAIVLMAFILRVFFAYGTSADSGFALSGGSDAAYHLHVIVQILTNGGHVVTDPALNYPFGGLNYNPPLFDWSVAAVAYPLTLLGYSVTGSASAALVFSTATAGSLTCIPVYLLAKEMFSRRAAIVASAFFAISSVAIVKTVFSNGTESAYFVLFFVLTTLFLLRAVKAFKRADDDLPLLDGLFAPFKDKTVFRNMLLAGLSLTALMLSWIGFLTVIVLFSFVMAVQAVTDRLRGKNAIGYVMIYGSVMLFALLVSSLYYILVMGMLAIIAGPACLLLIVGAVSIIISSWRIWVLSFPVSLAIVIVSMAAIWFLVPSLFTAMTAGVYPYAEGKFGQMLTAYTGVTLSTQAIYAGVVTMWFAVILTGYRLIRLPKKADSPSYLFVTMWFVALLYFSWRNADLAYLAAPMYAIGAGVVIMYVLRRVHIKEYIESFKGCTIRSVWRKVIKPLPFVTVLATVFVLLTPNVLYAVDASIPSNEKSNYNENMHLGAASPENINYLGATNYYIRDSDWSMTQAWNHYGNAAKSGALVTWLDYGAEAIAKGKFNVVADHFGNGSAAASNILLGDPSEAIAAMTVRLLLTGDGQLVNKVISDAGVRTELKRILFEGRSTVDGNPIPNKEYVAMNPDIFGATDSDISDENAMYLAAVRLLTTSYTDGEISDIYNKAVKETGHEIGYIGVTGSMLPIYYGDSSLFSTLAYLNDYHLDRNASPSKYYWAGIPYVGYYYSYEDVMYETMIWKSLVGMSLNDFRAFHGEPTLSHTEIMRGLMVSDGTYKAVPGFGMGSFTVDKWWVLYNPDDTAPYDKWELMDGYEAQALQESSGGLINYLGGMVFLKYNKNTDILSGSVSTPAPGEPVAGVTVAIFDEHGKLLGKTVTDADGKYSLAVPKGKADTIGVYSGSVYSMEIYNGDAAVLNVTIEMSDADGTIVSVGADVEGINVTLVGRVTGKEYTFTTDAAGYFDGIVVPDVYDVTMMSDDIAVYTGTFTLYPGIMNIGEINIKEVTVDVTVRERYTSSGPPVPGVTVVIIDKDGKQVAEGETNDKGVARMFVAPGTYTVQVKDPGDGWMLVSNSATSTSTMFTATLGSTSSPVTTLVQAEEIKIEDVKEGDLITLRNGAYTPRGTYTTTVLVEADGDVTVHVPIGDYDKLSVYTATKVAALDKSISYAKIDAATKKITATAWEDGDHEVSIKMTYGSGADEKANAGMVVLIPNDMEDMMIHIPMSAGKDDPEYTVVKVPAGRYTVYAYAFLPEKKAYIGSIDVNADKTLDINLKNAIAVGGNVTSTGSSRITFVPVTITAPDGERIIAPTDGVGAYYLMLPVKESSTAFTANTEMLFGNFIGRVDPLSITVAANAASDMTTQHLTSTSTSTSINANGAQGGDTFKIEAGVTDVPIKEGDNVDVEYSVTSINDAAGTARIDIKNNGTAILYGILRSTDGAEFRIGTSATPVSELMFSITSSGTRQVNVLFTSGHTPEVELTVLSTYATVGLDLPADIMPAGIERDNHSIKLLSGSTEQEPNADGKYNIRPGSYTVTIKPDLDEVSDGYDRGYYYTGTVVVYAGMKTVDLVSLLTKVMVVYVETGDKDDKVTLSMAGVVEDEKSKAEQTKKYYVPLDDDDKFSGTITVDAKNGKIAYLDVDETSLPIDMTEYLGEKVTVSGYAGRVAAGEMTITMSTGGAAFATVKVPITRGEYEAVLPITIPGVTDPNKIEYKFNAVMTDTVNGVGRAFLGSVTVPEGDLVVKTVGGKSAAKVNMEAKVGSPDLTPSNPSTFFTVYGNVSEGSNNLSAVIITYEIDGKEGMTLSNNTGDYSITAADGEVISITKVEKTGYRITALPIPHTGTDLEQDLVMEFDVSVVQGATSFAAGKSTITMTVTNHRDSTVVLFPGKGWSIPSFSVDGGASHKYAVIPALGTYTVVMTADYNPNKVGAGSDSLSVIVRDLTGTTLQTKTLDTKTGPSAGSLSDLDAEPEGNRVSKYEYGYAATFTNDTDKWVSITLQKPIAPAGWFVSVVDSNNVILEGADLTVTIPGQSSAVYFVRLISEGAAPDTEPTGLVLRYGPGADDKVDLTMEATNLTVNNLAASGNNIFGSLNGMPTIVWVLLVLSMLMVMLIVWLGMRRGVFLRKR